jgi:hypothetical protein
VVSALFYNWAALRRRAPGSMGWETDCPAPPCPGARVKASQFPPISRQPVGDDSLLRVLKTVARIQCPHSFVLHLI